MESFVADVLVKKKLARSTGSQLTAFHGELRAHLQDFQRLMNVLKPFFEQILSRLAFLQYTAYSGTAWADHWKVVSYEGRDFIRGREVDYGNSEYTVLLGCFCHWSPQCNQCMEWLGTHYFPSLHPHAELTDHSKEMKGDVLEICMAALRGHPEFAEVLPTEGLPQIFNALSSVCQTIQMLDACIRTGKLKWQDRRMALITSYRPDLGEHPFVLAWRHGDERQRQVALRALLV